MEEPRGRGRPRGSLDKKPRAPRKVKEVQLESSGPLPEPPEPPPEPPHIRHMRNKQSMYDSWFKYLL